MVIQHNTTYNKNGSKTSPKSSGWYDTDKGNLYYFADSGNWSSRDEYVSDEYPTLWYEGLLD